MVLGYTEIENIIKKNILNFLHIAKLSTAIPEQLLANVVQVILLRSAFFYSSEYYGAGSADRSKVGLRLLQSFQKLLAYANLNPSLEVKYLLAILKPESNEFVRNLTSFGDEQLLEDEFYRYCKCLVEEQALEKLYIKKEFRISTDSDYVTCRINKLNTNKDECNVFLSDCMADAFFIANALNKYDVILSCPGFNGLQVNDFFLLGLRDWIYKTTFCKSISITLMMGFSDTHRILSARCENELSIVNERIDLIDKNLLKIMNNNSIYLISAAPISPKISGIFVDGQIRVENLTNAHKTVEKYKKIISRHGNCDLLSKEVETFSKKLSDISSLRVHQNEIHPKLSKIALKNLGLKHA